MIHQSPFWKPKFIQTAFAQGVASIALFTGHIDQGGYITLTTMIIGMFTAASVTENKLVPPVPAPSDKS